MAAPGVAQGDPGKELTMSRKEAGMTLIEILVVIAILATIMGTVALLIGPSTRQGDKLSCIRNVGNLVGLIETGGRGRYPESAGANFVLYVAQKGEIAGRDNLETLFCPGDQQESFTLTGGEEAYEDLDLKSYDNGHLTSYAGRAQNDKKCRVSRGGPRAHVLIADDSEDHHHGFGFVVGLTGGTAKFRDKVDYYELALDQPIEVGEGSAVEELRCLRAE